MQVGLEEVEALEESYQMVQAHLHFVYLDTLELLLSMSMLPIPGNPLKSRVT
jgi:hypothetical protein